MKTEKGSPQLRRTGQDFRLFLQDELASRCTRNPNYSLRSFAKLLGVSPASLSALINGKRPVTHKMKERLGLKLGLTISDIKNLKSAPHGNTKINSDSLDAESFQQVTLDAFNIISEPYHYALLELTKTKDFKPDSKWIAQRLKITVSEVNIAIERLERLNFLMRDEAGNMSDTSEGFRTDIREGLSSHAQREFQKRSLEHAISSIDLVPLNRRDNTSMTMAVNEEDLEEAKRFIKEFRRKFCRRLETNPVLNEVYQLTISFVPVTQSLGGKT